jgi:hypothetical protein
MHGQVGQPNRTEIGEQRLRASWLVSMVWPPGRSPPSSIATTGLNPYYRAGPARPGLVIGFSAANAPTLAAATYQLRHVLDCDVSR